MMRKLFVLFVMLSCIYSANAHDTTFANIDTLKVLFEQMIDADEITAKKKINIDILNRFEKILDDTTSFFASFDSVPSLGVIGSPDTMFRIYNWNLPLRKGKHKYFGFIQCRNGQYFLLSDSSHKIKDPEHVTLSFDRWYGALYYDIIVREKWGKKYYTLLGFDFNDLFTSKKIIEVLYIDEKGEPCFGTPIFQMKKEIKHRVVFEFSAQVVMSLKYEEDKSMIVFDHLAPREPKYEGIYHYYGPDFTFDALKFEDGRWKLIEDVDITF